MAHALYQEPAYVNLDSQEHYAINVCLDTPEAIATSSAVRMAVVEATAARLACALVTTTFREQSAMCLCAARHVLMVAPARITGT